MSNVELFYDPSCPWTWVTSRWLTTVAPERQLAVTWRTWSLPIKNQGRALPATLPPGLRERILAGREFSVQALRVLEAAGAKEGNEAQGRLYTELGRRFHGEGEGDGGDGDGGTTSSHAPSGEQVIADAVEAAGLAAELASAGHDENWDEPIRANMDEVSQQVGDDVGVPIIAVRDDDGWRAMSGPIIAEVPPLDRALALWDAVVTVVREPCVFELKRHRNAGPNLPQLDADGRLAQRRARQ